MYDGTIVKFNGMLYKKIEGKWVLLAADPSVWYPDAWMETHNIEVVVKAGPLDGVAEGTVVACEDGSIVAVYQGAGDWTISGAEDWYTTSEMLTYIGEDWKVIYKAGENNE